MDDKQRIGAEIARNGAMIYNAVEGHLDVENRHDFCQMMYWINRTAYALMHNGDDKTDPRGETAIAEREE